MSWTAGNPLLVPAVAGFLASWKTMTLPIMPPLVADAGQGGDRDPERRRMALRAEVGRLPLHRLPRRRHDRAGQPQRAAVHPLLPRAARAAAGVAAPALRRRRRDRRAGHRRSRARLRRAAAAHPPGRVPRPPAGRPRRRRRSSPSTCSRSTTTRCWIARWRSVTGCSTEQLAVRSPSCVPLPAHAPTPRSPNGGSPSSRAPVSTAWSPSGSATRTHPTSAR